MDRDLLVAAACETTGLTDFGDAAWQDGLDRLLDSLTAEARLTELGAAIITAEVGAYLGNRLQTTHWRRRHPEVAQGDIRAPIFIRGSTPHRHDDPA